MVERRRGDWRQLSARHLDYFPLSAVTGHGRRYKKQISTPDDCEVNGHEFHSFETCPTQRWASRSMTRADILAPSSHLKVCQRGFSEIVFLSS